MPQNLKSLVTQSLYPKITNVAIGTATAAIPAGGETVTVTGSGFQANAEVWINNANVSTTFVNDTSLTFTSTAQSVGFYQLSVYNTDGSVAFKPGGLIYNSAPVWSTSSGSLSGAPLNIAYNTTIVATGGTIAYSITSGSLPTGLSLNSSSGVISGTATTENNFNFTVAATNQYNQVTTRSFSIAVVSAPTTVETLVVAGGGGGGGTNDSNAGGAGAGGLLYGNMSITPTVTYTITVGAGGPGGTTGANGTNGYVSSIVASAISYSATANGGGYGAGGNTGNSGGTGGSGGGGRGWPGSTSGGAANQGNSGGLTGYGFAGQTGVGYAPGGGGGAGEAGGTDSTGQGGDGRQYSQFGGGSPSGFYAGGGGAGGGSGQAYPGGDGGGGAGSNGVGNGSSGVSNTGGGGGGSYQANGGSQTGGNGGSGVVIIRYADTFIAATTTGNPTYTVVSGYRIYTFTGNGSITF